MGETVEITIVEHLTEFDRPSIHGSVNYSVVRAKSGYCIMSVGGLHPEIEPQNQIYAQESNRRDKQGNSQKV